MAKGVDINSRSLVNAQAEKHGGICARINADHQLKSKAADILLAALFEPDSAVLSHCKNVSRICEAVARRMNLSGDEIGEIKTAGMLHDVGKTEISDALLNKLGQLDDDEWERIKQHAAIGCDIVGSIDGFSRVAGFILEHHEHWDGSGYPNGLRGNKISLQARIIAVADAFDAMTSDRPYKKAVGTREALAEIQANAGTQFDPDVVEEFMSVLCPEALYA